MVAPHTIKEHMEVVGSDGVHVGTVDHMEGADEMKLTKGDEEAGGEHHFIPLAWVDHVDRRCTSSSQAPRPRRAGKRTRTDWPSISPPSGTIAGGGGLFARQSRLREQRVVGAAADIVDARIDDAVAHDLDQHRRVELPAVELAEHHREVGALRIPGGLEIRAELDLRRAVMAADRELPAAVRRASASLSSAIFAASPCDACFSDRPQ